MPFPDALKDDPKVIFFTDFDGTITLKDTNDFMTDNYGFGIERRRELNEKILDETETFRDGFQKMLNSWTTSFPETVDILKKNISLDPYFSDFMKFASANKIPVVVLSSGMVPIIRGLLNKLLGEEVTKTIEIVANDAKTIPPINDLNKPGGWSIQYHDDSGFGHDKSLAIRPYAEAVAKMPDDKKPTLLYAGDGTSDLSAARETDLLFAKAGHDLITYCEKKGIPFTIFEDWKSILDTTRDIFDGRNTVKKVAAEGLKKARNSPELTRQKSI